MKKLILMATMLLMHMATRAQVCGHLEIRNNNLYKGIQKSMITNINDMWDFELVAENVSSYVTYQTTAYWRCTVLVLKINGELFKYTISGENKGFISKNVSEISSSGDMIFVSFKDGSSKMMLAAD